MSAKTPTLHRLHRPGMSTMWRIADTPLALQRSRSDTDRTDRWRITPAPSSSMGPLTISCARRWLNEQNLNSASFATRRDALHTAAAYLATDPIPSRPRARLQPDGPGRWICAELTLTIIRHPNGHYYAQDTNGLVLGSAWTLTELAHRIATAR